ncbi:MAG: carboxymuconolactone decarboxylase family protein [Halanaerobiales bacterium]
MSKNPLDIIKENDEELFEAISNSRETAFKENALSKKNKLLIALALDAARGAENGVKSLAQQAIKEGATKEEILDTLRITFYITGAGSIYTAARALNDIL